MSDSGEKREEGNFTGDLLRKTRRTPRTKKEWLLVVFAISAEREERESGIHDELKEKQPVDEGGRFYACPRIFFS